MPCMDHPPDSIINSTDLGKTKLGKVNPEFQMKSLDDLVPQVSIAHGRPTLSRRRGA
jgi:hypothetical protein